MDAGLKMAADPANANLPELALRITTLHSAWYMDTCRVCRNKFREGDRVRLCPRCGRPHHDDAQFNLSCWQDHYGDGGICTEGRIDRFHGHEIEACSYRWNGRLPDAPQSDETPEIMPAPAAVNQFVAGLRDVWRPFGDKQIYKVRPGDAMVGRNCPWCRLRIRAGDWVVSCPCGCGTYFHEDIFRHLTCWNEWNGVEGNDYCPNTARSYDEEEER
jgi:hypothetical protein